MFAPATAAMVGSLAYLLSAKSRGLLGWEEVPVVTLAFLCAAAMPVAVGCVFLAALRRKQAAPRAYDDQVASVVERANRSADGQDPPPRA